MTYQIRAETTTPAVDEQFLLAVLNGLAAKQKSLPCRYFYDRQGSALFEQITQLPEYYPTRTETALLERYGSDIAKLVPTGASVVEFGSGSSRKTEILLASLKAPAAYIPIEISASALIPACARIRQSFPDIAVHPILGGFEDLHTLQLHVPSNARIGFFPGSTIGNFERHEAISFLQSARSLLGPDALFLLGADLVKPLDVLLPAYDDKAGVTAAFNLNILTRINRELDGTFDLSQFRHIAIYNDALNRVEMHLQALKPMTVFISGHEIAFCERETIHTENSHKYSIDDLRALAAESGWHCTKTWVDPDRLFSIHLLS